MVTVFKIESGSLKTNIKSKYPLSVCVHVLHCPSHKLSKANSILQLFFLLDTTKFSATIIKYAIKLLLLLMITAAAAAAVGFS